MLLTAIELALDYNITESLLRNSLRRNSMNISKALNGAEIRQRLIPNAITYKGKEYTSKGVLCEEFKINKTDLHNTLNSGFSQRGENTAIDGGHSKELGEDIYNCLRPVIIENVSKVLVTPLIATNED